MFSDNKRLYALASTFLRLLSNSAQHCLVCGIQHRAVSLLCRNCMEQITWIRTLQCRVCGRPDPCSDCIRRGRHYLYCNRSAVRYDKTMKTWLARFKYRGDERLTPVFVELICYAFYRLLKDISLNQDQIDAVTYVPLSAEREAERGFNQAELLAEGLAETFDLPLYSLVKRHQHSQKQSLMSKRERIASLQQAFVVQQEEVKRLLQSETYKRKINQRNTCLNIIVVDDIYTTGNTLNQVAKVMMEWLPARCFGLTCARS